MQRRGLPDVACVIAGRAVWIEVKARGKRSTAIQARVQRELRAAGAYAGVMDSVDQVEEMLAAFPDVCRACFAPLTGTACSVGHGFVDSEGKWNDTTA